MFDQFASNDTHQERVIIKIDDVEKTHAQLIKAGCQLTKKTTQQDTYLIQPEGEILKIVHDEENPTLVRLHENEGKLDVVSEKAITPKQAQEIKDHYGVRVEVTNKNAHYTYERVTVTIVKNEKGAFLVLQADNIGEEIYEELNIKDPTIVQTSFAFL